MTKHRILLTAAISLFAWANVTWSQQAERVHVVGVLALSAGPNDSIHTALRRGLSELGYTEGRDFRIEYRGAQGRADRLPQLAQELVRSNVEVIVTGTEITTRAAKQATTTIPIVAILPDHDPVSSGLIESFSRPGANITGLTSRDSLLVRKRLQLLKEVLPGLSRVTVPWDASVYGEVKELQVAARQLGIQLQLVEMKPTYDFAAVFADARRQKAGAVMLLSSPEVYIRLKQLGALALKHKLPVDAPFRDLTAAGGLITYSTDVEQSFFRGAYFIDRLLKGAKPADLPFEQSENIQFIINLGTAKALALKIPQAVLVRATEVIQ